MRYELVWFDSLGAKSSCIFVETPDVKIVIDPGVAIMHGSFPASWENKKRWLEEGYRRVKSALIDSDVVIITHYHYDHFLPNDIELYYGKTLLVKNPNEYINDSQRDRALHFFSKLYEFLGVEMYVKNPEKTYEDPLKRIPEALSIKYGDYSERKKELIEKGYKWFWGRTEKWRAYKWIREHEKGDTKIIFAENKRMKYGKTTIRFTEPFFHGIEFSRVGWVYSVVIEYGGERLLHSSDLNGPIIEDYARWIIEENPEVLILDGPMTYMLGYMLNKINLKRAIDNAVNIVRNTEFKVMVYDHHLPREERFRERTEDVWMTAERLKKRVLTASEYMGKRPVVLRNKDI